MPVRHLDAIATTLRPKAPTVVDLFCGAGGLSLGFHDAGARVLLAVDHAACAIETHRANLDGEALLTEIGVEQAIPDADIVVGGPPCQGFTSAGMRRAGDRRNTLVGVFAALVARSRPSAFLFENVEGFLTAEQGRRVLELLEPLVEGGYRIQVRKVNAANYGVPQHRKRVVALGGLGWTPQFPAVTHTAFGAPGSHLAGRHLPVTPSVLDAIGGLPTARTEPPGEPADHWYRAPEGLDLERARRIGEGQTMRDLPRKFWHESYGTRAFRRVSDGTPSERRGGAPAGVRRLVGAEPSKAITSAARREFLHPHEDRYLTLRECATLQTFPLSYRFEGTVSEKATMIGNGVPPLLARVLAASLLQQLAGADVGAEPGALVAFIPTLSRGMSPALEGVQRLVSERFASVERRAEQAVLWP